MNEKKEMKIHEMFTRIQYNHFCMCSFSRENTYTQMKTKGNKSEPIIRQACFILSG